MRATELLTRDYDEVKRLFQEFETRKGEERRQVFEQAASRLIVHSQLEQTLLYPILESFEETRGLVEEALREHQMVEGAITKLSTMDVDDPQFAETFTRMRTRVIHLATEEERQLFPEAIRLLGDSRLQRMGQQIETQRPQLEPEAREVVRRRA